jgi:hypothetical protein
MRFDEYYLNEVIKFPEVIYSGQKSRKGPMTKPRFDKSRLGVGKDQEGVGFYFTTNKREARGYAFPNGIIITAKFSGNLIDKDTQVDVEKAEQLIEMSSSLDDILPDWGYDPPYVSREQALSELKSSVINEDDAKDTFLQIWYDLYYRRGSNEEFVDNMVKLGYDGLLIERAEGVKHIVVYDPDALNILDVEKYKEVKESYMTTVRPSKAPWEKEQRPPLEIFKNPTKNEINKILSNSDFNEARIVVTKDGNVLVWNGDATHIQVLEKNKKLLDNTLDTYYYSPITLRIHKDKYITNSGKFFGKDLTEEQQRQIIKVLKKYFPMADIHPRILFRYSDNILGKPNNTGNI